MPSIKLKAEPELATLPTLKHKARYGTLKPKADDGENDDTLNNMISYEVQQVSPLKIKEVAIGDGTLHPIEHLKRLQELTIGVVGHLSSSTFLDANFRQNIEAIVGEAQCDNGKKSNRKKKMKGFGYGIQQTSNEKDDQVYSVDLRSIMDSSEKCEVKGNTMTVTMYATPLHSGARNIPPTLILHRDALRLSFDHVSSQIEHLLSEQIVRISEKGLSIKVGTHQYAEGACSG
ncbi:MAG: hypothetical protein Q9168_005227 [Polycauliona sp. 1 TL-2023]